MLKLRTYSVALIPCLLSAYLAWKIILQLDLPFGLEEYVMQLILLMKGVGGNRFNPTLFLSVALLRFYDLISSIKLVLAILYSLTPLSMYFFTYDLFKSRLIALISAFLTPMLVVGLLGVSLEYANGFLIFLLLPIALVALRRLLVKGSWHYAVVLVAVVVLMLLSDLKICYLTSIALTLFVVYNYSGRNLVMLLPSLVLSYVIMTYYTLTVGLGVKVPDLDLLNPLALLAITCTIAGICLVARSRRSDLPYVIIPLISMIMLLPTTINYILMLLSIPALPLISFLSIFHRNSIQSVKLMEDEGCVYEVTIDLDRLIPLVLIAVLILASLYNVYMFTASYEAFPSESSHIRRLSTAIKNSIPPGSCIIAPFNLSVWIEALAGLEVLNNYGYDLEVDAIISTNYRLMNSYLIVDDTNPIMHLYTPRIKVYDGYEYKDLMVINDGNVSLSISNTTVYLYSNYVVDVYEDELDNSFLLTTIYKLPSLAVRKVEALSKWNPALNITYSINAQHKYTLEAKIPLEIYDDAELMIKDDGVLITTNQHTIHLAIRSSGDVNVNFNNSILTIKSCSTKSLDIKIMFTIPSAKKSHYKPWISTLRDLLEFLNVNYVVGKRLNDFLQALQHREVSLVKFNNLIGVLGVKDGKPFYQEISEDHIVEVSNRSTIYETSNFIVNRSLLNNSIVYDVKPKGSILNFLILNYEVALNGIKNWAINQSKATFEYKGSNLEVVFSRGFHTDAIPDPKHFKLRVIVMIPLNQTGDVFNIYFKSFNVDVMVKKVENEQIMLYTHVGFLTKIDEFNEYVVYRVDV